MDTSISVIGFKMTYPVLNLELFKKDIVHYNLGIHAIAVSEFNKGFKIKRIGKATKKGTGITFEPIKTENEAIRIREELISEQQRLLDLIVNKI